MSCTPNENAAPEKGAARAYCGRIAPTPTGLLHLGHAATFWTAHRRARDAGGSLVLRIEDLDSARCREEFTRAAIDDLAWLGISWTGNPVRQSDRMAFYLAAWRRLRDAGLVYPCRRSRRDVATAALAPHGDEPVFPPEWRGPPDEAAQFARPDGVNWRFRVPDGRRITFHDARHGRVVRVAGRDFGDFLVWNRDGVPSYELAVAVDDATMTEVVRGEDLLTSTARQILLHEAFGHSPPRWFHCPLARDPSGRRLAKRTPAMTLREHRAAGATPDDVLHKAFLLTGQHSPGSSPGSVNNS